MYEKEKHLQIKACVNKSCYQYLSIEEALPSRNPATGRKMELHKLALSKDAKNAKTEK